MTTPETRARRAAIRRARADNAALIAAGYPVPTVYQLANRAAAGDVEAQRILGRSDWRPEAPQAAVARIRAASKHGHGASF